MAELLEIRFDTPESQKLIEGILTGEEFKTLDVQLAQLRKNKECEGSKEIRIKAEKRFVLVHTYKSSVLGAIFVLSYHLERKGEPTAKQMETVKAYEAEIQRLEQKGAGNGKD